MKKNKTIGVFFVVLYLLTISYAAETIYDLVEDGDFLWLASRNGLIKFNKETTEYTYFTKENTGLPDNFITRLAKDSLNRIWIGINTNNNGIGYVANDHYLPYNSGTLGVPRLGMLGCFKFDEYGNFWIGSAIYLQKYDGKKWHKYEIGPNSIPVFRVTDISIQTNGNVWIGSWYGLYELCNDTIIWYNDYENFKYDFQYFLKTDDKLWACGSSIMTYDGNVWSKINTDTSEIPNSIYSDIKMDSKGNIWIASGKGLIKYDGTNWYNKNNSNLPAFSIKKIIIDQQDNIWLINEGSGYSLKKFDGENIIKYDFENTNIKNEDKSVKSLFLNQNYPNPFNPSTTIEFYLPKKQNVEICIYSIDGKRVTNLVNKSMKMGYHTINWNATNENENKVPSGFYFYQMKCDGEIFTKKMLYIK